MYELTPVLAECSNMAGGHVNSKKRRASIRKRASRARACICDKPMMQPDAAVRDLEERRDDPAQ